MNKVIVKFKLENSFFMTELVSKKRGWCLNQPLD
jgi:hypothetical protein